MTGDVTMMSGESFSTPLETDGELAFEVEFGCDNCGDEWGEAFPSGVFVEDGSSKVYIEESESFVTGNHVVCPTCEMSQGVFVEGRSPLE